MDVLKFKKTGDVYFVQYEENEDIKTLKTEDEPESELTTAMDNMARAAMVLFKLEITGKLQGIDWKDGEKAGSKCTLISGESMFGQFKTFLPKVTTQEAETPEEGIYDPENLKNQYNTAADELRKEVKRFLEGACQSREKLFFISETCRGMSRRHGVVAEATARFTSFYALWGSPPNTPSGQFLWEEIPHASRGKVTRPIPGWGITVNGEAPTGGRYRFPSLSVFPSNKCPREGPKAKPSRAGLGFLSNGARNPGQASAARCRTGASRYGKGYA
jgi:hypothetical protein